MLDSATRTCVAKWQLREIAAIVDDVSEGE